MDVTFERAVDDFERQLDALTRTLQPAPLGDDPPPPAGVDDRLHRINRKRIRLAAHLHHHPQAAVDQAPAVFEAMVHDIDASFVRMFVDPMFEAVGRRAVQEAILHHLETGSPTAQIGAAMAWYHSQAPLTYIGAPDGEPTHVSKAAYDAVADLRDRHRRICLHLFVHTGHEQVRRTVSRWVSVDPHAHPDSDAELVARARAIAEQHPDTL